MDSTPFPFESTTMPFTTAQIAAGANYALASHSRKEPVDQINTERPTLKWLIDNKEESIFSNGSYKEPIYIANGSNAQNYFGADSVSFNERDPVRHTDFAYYNMFDGFWIDDDRLLAAGITMTDDGSAVPTRDEKAQLQNIIKQSYRGLREGMQDALNFELLRDGTQSSKACPGLTHLIRANPATGTVGGINAATATYWRNNANTGIAAANVIDAMETTYKDVRRFGGMLPTFIPCGRAFYENYVKQSAVAIQRHQAVSGANGVRLDASVDAVNFHGVELVWDPTFEALDALLGGSTWTKSAFFLNPKAVKLRPVKRNWMVDHKPKRPTDQFVTYFGRTAKYGLTTDKRNALALLTIA